MVYMYKKFNIGDLVKVSSVDLVGEIVSVEHPKFGWNEEVEHYLVVYPNGAWNLAHPKTITKVEKDEDKKTNA